jgi:hypothetical protein
MMPASSGMSPVAWIELDEDVLNGPGLGRDELSVHRIATWLPKGRLQKARIQTCAGGGRFSRSRRSAEVGSTEGGAATARGPSATEAPDGDSARLRSSRVDNSLCALARSRTTASITAGRWTGVTAETAAACTVSVSARSRVHPPRLVRVVAGVVEPLSVIRVQLSSVRKPEARKERIEVAVWLWNSRN